MPLFVNGEWFNPSLKKEEQPSAHKNYKVEYDQFMREAQSFKHPVELRVARVQKRNTDSRGTPIEPPTDNLSYKQSIVTSDGVESWVFQKNFPEKTDKGYRFSDLAEWVRGSLRIQKHEKDKLFYFFRKSGYVGKTLIHYDPEAIARKKAEDNALKAQLYFHVYNTEAPLVKDFDRLKEVAQSFGVKKTYSLSRPEIQNSLFEVVSQGDDIRSRGVRAFLDMIGNYDRTKREAEIQQAIEKEIIVFNSADSEWKFVSRGKETATICKIEPGARGSKVDALLDHLKNKPAEENRVLIGARTGSLTNLKPEDIENLTSTELKRECEVAGISRVGRKKEDYLDELRQWAEFYNTVKA